MTAFLGAALVLSPAAFALDAVPHLALQLEASPSVKVRSHAAALLVRTKDGRAWSALAAAAQDDPSAIVRSLAVRLLAGHPGGATPEAAAIRNAVNAARSDRSPDVRRAAQATWLVLARKMAVAATPGSTRNVAVGRMGDKTGRASPALKDRMRREILGHLAHIHSVHVVAEAGPPPPGFVVDGSITKLDSSRVRGQLETTCAVQLLVSRPPRGIVMTTTGEATVQQPQAATVAPPACVRGGKKRP